MTEQRDGGHRAAFHWSCDGIHTCRAAARPNADPWGVGRWYVNADRTIWAGSVRMVAGPNGNQVLWIRLPCRYSTGFQASGLAFPTEGCWQISARAGTSDHPGRAPEPPLADAFPDMRHVTRRTVAQCYRATRRSI